MPTPGLQAGLAKRATSANSSSSSPTRIPAGATPNPRRTARPQGRNRSHHGGRHPGEHWHRPAPERSRRRTWRQFLSHWETLYACDFFAVETLGAFGTVRYMVFFVMELKSRAAHIAGVRVDPDGAFMAQVARNLLDPVDGLLRNATISHP